MKRKTYYDILTGTVVLLFLLAVPNIKSATGSESDDFFGRYLVVPVSGHVSVCVGSEKTVRHLGSTTQAVCPDSRPPQILTLYCRHPERGLPRLSAQQKVRQESNAYAEIEERKEVIQRQPQQMFSEVSGKAVVVEQQAGQPLQIVDSREGHVSLFYTLGRLPYDLDREENREIISPRQCPYRTWNRNVSLPLVGDLDVRLFCIPPR